MSSFDSPNSTGCSKQSCDNLSFRDHDSGDENPGFADSEIPVFASYDATDVSSPVLQATIDSLPAHLAILDEDGTIISVNAAWRRYANSSDFSGESYGLGANYLSVCARATGSNAEEAPLVLQGLREVLGGARDEFYLEYPRHAPNQQVWYALRATRFWNTTLASETQETLRVVVTHEDISRRKLAEIGLREETEITATLYRIGLIVAGELDAGKLVEAITQAAVELTGATIGAFLPSPQESVAPPYSWGEGVSNLEYALSSLDPRAMFGPDPVGFGDALRSNVISFETAETIQSDDLQADARFDGIEIRNTNRAPELRTPFGAGGAIASGGANCGAFGIVAGRAVSGSSRSGQVWKKR